MARKPSSSGSPDLPSAKDPTPITEGLSQTIMPAEMISVSMPSRDALGHVALGIDRLLSRERQLLDRQEQPHGKRQGSKNAVDAEWEVWAVAFRKLGAVRRDIQRPAVEIEMRKGADPEDDEHGERRQRHHQRDPE